MNTVTVSTPAYYEASRTPDEAIKLVTYEGQNPKLRMYRPGYGFYLDNLPILNPADPKFKAKLAESQQVMKDLATQLRGEPWIHENAPEENEFDRTILAIEDPYMTPDNPTLKEGVELIVARWGNGFTSPIHGHAPGLLDEELISGVMRVNTYRLSDHKKGIVRPLATEIFKNDVTIASTFTAPGKYYFQREGVIHNFTSIGNSVSAHYVPEHTRDGRDNRFEVEYFEDVYKLTSDDVKQVDAKTAMYSQKGDVILVRSTNVPEYGDHYIVITGAPVMKEHGLRPQDVAIYAPHTKEFLDQYPEKVGLTLLKLNVRAKEAFLEFHAIRIENNEVVFPGTEQVFVA